MVNYNTEVNTLYEYMIARDNTGFEIYRSKLLKQYDYATFKMILKQAQYKLNAVDYKFEQITGD